MSDLSLAVTLQLAQLLSSDADIAFFFQNQA